MADGTTADLDGAAHELPHNIEAEQALLGALLVNNDVYDRVASIVQAAHFFDPVHARIFEVAAERIRRNALATPVTIKAFLEEDAGLKELVVPLSRAAIAVGADGVIVDVHPSPETALCDGPQAILGNDLRSLAQAVRQLPPLVGRATANTALT